MRTRTRSIPSAARELADGQRVRLRREIRRCTSRKEQLPRRARAFWSLVDVRRPASSSRANAINRYALGDRDASAVQRRRVARRLRPARRPRERTRRRNWLPAPQAGPFCDEPARLLARAVRARGVLGAAARQAGGVKSVDAASDAPRGVPRARRSACFSSMRAIASVPEREAQRRVLPPRRGSTIARGELVSGSPGCWWLNVDSPRADGTGRAGVVVDTVPPTSTRDVESRKSVRKYPGSTTVTWMPERRHLVAQAPRSDPSTANLVDE